MVFIGALRVDCAVNLDPVSVAVTVGMAVTEA